MMGMYNGPVEGMYQLVAALISSFLAALLLYGADRARRQYNATGENDPEINATAVSNLRDEGFRLTKHLLFVVIGIVTVMPHIDAEDRMRIVRWILIMCSTVLLIQSFMVWRDRKASQRRGIERDRVTGLNRRHTDRMYKVDE